MAFDLSEEQVALTESELGRRLPPVYRAAMMANNGGTAITDEDQWDIHPIKDVSDRKRMSRSCNDIIAETKAARGWRAFPSDALAIGSNGLGDVMLLLPSQTEPATFSDLIFAYWHETGEVKPLADDFSTFEIE
jgi:hypothetical protein